MVWTDLAAVHVWCEAQNCPAMTVRWFFFFGRGSPCMRYSAQQSRTEGTAPPSFTALLRTVGAVGVQQWRGMDPGYTMHYGIRCSNSITVKIYSLVLEGINQGGKQCCCLLLGAWRCIQLCGRWCRISFTFKGRTQKLLCLQGEPPVSGSIETQG